MEKTTVAENPAFEEQREYWDERWNRQRWPNKWQLRRGQTILDLARGLGVALKSVSRAFQDLIGNGVLEKRGARYLVKNLEALKAQAPGASHGIDWVAGRRLTG